MPFQRPNCNCPDAVHRREANPISSNFSEQFGSDWSAGFNGAEFCQHELSVLIIREELDEIGGAPTDYPTPPSVNLVASKYKQRLQRNSRLGDSFL